MKNLTSILDEIALAAADVSKLATMARSGIHANMEREAREKLAELFRIQRQVMVLTNTVRDVLDAMDAAQIAHGDLDGAKQVYMEV